MAFSVLRSWRSTRPAPELQFVSRFPRLWVAQTQTAQMRPERFLTNAVPQCNSELVWGYLHVIFPLRPAGTTWIVT